MLQRLAYLAFVWGKAWHGQRIHFSMGIVSVIRRNQMVTSLLPGRPLLNDHFRVSLCRCVSFILKALACTSFNLCPARKFPGCPRRSRPRHTPGWVNRGNLFSSSPITTGRKVTSISPITTATPIQRYANTACHDFVELEIWLTTFLTYHIAVHSPSVFHTSTAGGGNNSRLGSRVWRCNRRASQRSESRKGISKYLSGAIWC